MFQIIKRSIAVLMLMAFFWMPSVSFAEANSGVANQQRSSLSMTDIPNLRLRDYPPIEVTEELISNLQPLMPEEVDFGWTVGDRVPVTEVLQVGNFTLFGLSDVSIGQIAGATGTNLSEVRITDMKGLVSSQTPDNLMRMSRLRPDISSSELGSVPALSSLVEFQLGLTDVPSEVPDLSALNSYLNPGTNENVAVPLSRDELFARAQTLTVEQYAELVPEFKGLRLGSMGEEALNETGSLNNAIPGIGDVPLNQFEGSTNQQISSLSGVGFENLSLSQLPEALSLVEGVVLGLADVALGTPRDGDREQMRVRIVSGGIPDRSMILVGGECRGNSCPHFEIAAPTSLNHGAAWLDPKGQEVNDGFGSLCQPWDCKGPPGNHPFGPNVRVLITEVEQTQGRATIAISFPYCATIPFEGLSCTPWILPTAEGIPLGELKEESPVVFLPPGLRVPGEVREGNARPPEVGGIEDGPEGSGEPTGPIPPPAPCPTSGGCALHHPLPQWSGVPLDGLGACRSNCGRRHAGVDIQSRKGFQNSTRRGGNCSRSPGRLPCGEVVVSAANGVVNGVTPVGGNCGGIVKVRHSSPSIQTEYLHLARIDVRNGQQVQRGQVLGIEGDERPGRCSFGTHLHYQVRVNGALVNPLNYRHEPPLRAR